MSISSASYRGEMPHDSRPPLRRPPMCPAAAHLPAIAGCCRDLEHFPAALHHQQVKQVLREQDIVPAEMHNCSSGPAQVTHGPGRLAQPHVTGACACLCEEKMPTETKSGILPLQLQYRGRTPGRYVFKSFSNHVTAHHTTRMGMQLSYSAPVVLCKSSYIQHIRASQASAH